MRCEVGPRSEALRGRYQKRIKEMVQYAVADQFLGERPADMNQALLKQKFAELGAETCPRKIRGLFDEMTEILNHA